MCDLSVCRGHGAIRNSRQEKSRASHATPGGHFFPQFGKFLAFKKGVAERMFGGLAGKSIRNLYFFVSRALNRAAIEKFSPENPAKGVVLPKKEKPEMKTLPLDDLKKFFQEARRFGVFELYYMELSTGLRRRKLPALKWED